MAVRFVLATIASNAPRRLACFYSGQIAARQTLKSRDESLLHNSILILKRNCSVGIRYCVEHEGQGGGFKERYTERRAEMPRPK